MPRHTVQVNIEPWAGEALRSKAAYLAARVDQEYAAKMYVAETLPTRAERRAALAALYAERIRRRRAGELLDTASALFEHGLRREVEARGWQRRRFRAAPEGLVEMPGRRPGSTDNPAAPRFHRRRRRGDEPPAPVPEWSDSMAFTVAPELARLVRDAVTAVTADQVAAVQTGLRDRVMTTGDVWRAAIYRVTADWYPGHDLVVPDRVDA
ncbi:hypothetical protein ACFXGA_18650 [Actinosynnema sp. NPDC059335]|uniref:hypothetical protein n=1 Tax=Actinosynnema sp. NPDC059335 TaxID=3346804 RepID=UPI00366F476E